MTTVATRVDRRHFLLGAAALPFTVGAAGTSDGSTQELALELRGSLDEGQRATLCLPGDSRRRALFHSAWFVVPERLGTVLRPAQQELAQALFLSLYAPDFRPHVTRQVAEDNHAAGVNGLSLAFFGEPDSERGLGLTFSGRHVTRRWEAEATDPLSGPFFGGHASRAFHERADHPGNVWWVQGLAANELYRSLDRPQQRAALSRRASLDRPACLDGPRETRGLSFADLDADRLELARHLVHTILVRPFPAATAARALQAIESRGGLPALSMHLFRREDYGSDGVYDNFEVWGPGFLCHFRGAPHSHSWLSITG